MRHTVRQLEALPALPCPCGTSRRAFAGPEAGPCSVHLVEISAEAKAHYHKVMTETYVVLEGEGVLEIDGETVPLRPLTAVQIPPGCRHRAAGRLRILNIAVPAFDPADEWFD